MFKSVSNVLLATSLGLISVTAVTHPASALLRNAAPTLNTVTSTTNNVVTNTQVIAPIVAPVQAQTTTVTSATNNVVNNTQVIAPIFAPTQTQTATATNTTSSAITNSEVIASILAPIQIPTNTVATTTSGLEASLEAVKAGAAEHTITTVGDLAGASTDSQSSAELSLPTSTSEVKESIAQLIEQPLQVGGTASAIVSGNHNGINADSGIDLSVKVGNLATAKICLDGDASIGSAGDESHANCNPNQSKSVPEPATTGALAVLGVYFAARLRRSKASTARV